MDIKKLNEKLKNIINERKLNEATLEADVTVTCEGQDDDGDYCYEVNVDGEVEGSTDFYVDHLITDEDEMMNHIDLESSDFTAGDSCILCGYELEDGWHSEDYTEWTFGCTWDAEMYY